MMHEQVANDLAKLRILLPHWIEHNEEHAERFRGWAEKARKMGLEAVAERIEGAAKHMETCNEALTAAFTALKGGCTTENASIGRQLSGMN